MRDIQRRISARRLAQFRLNNGEVGVAMDTESRISGHVYVDSIGLNDHRKASHKDVKRYSRGLPGCALLSEKGNSLSVKRSTE